jgi:hypothetical protein
MLAFFLCGFPVLGMFSRTNATPLFPAAPALPAALLPNSSIFWPMRRAISRIPEKLLYPAPLLPQGTLLLGYDEKGRCPLLRRARCSIYDHRPLTCRSYDCRIFTAASLSPDRDEKGLISARVRAWRFRYPTKRDRDLQAAVKAAAKFIGSHSECFPEEKRPHGSAQTAVLAVRTYEVFLDKKIKSAHYGRAAQDKATTTAIINILKK